MLRRAARKVFDEMNSSLERPKRGGFFTSLSKRGSVHPVKGAPKRLDEIELDAAKQEIQSVKTKAVEKEDEPKRRKGGRPPKTLDTKINGIQGFQAPTGTSTEAFLRRLDKDRPDIHARVMAGELSAHAGMIEAGFRKKAQSRLRGGGPESRA